MNDDWPIRLSWIGVIVGLFVGGPLGALLGWFVGRRLDKRRERRRTLAEMRGVDANTVGAAVVALAAKLSKADGLVTAGEVRAFKQIFDVAPEDERRIGELWYEAKQSRHGYEAVAAELADAYRSQPAMLEQVYLALRAIAEADGNGIDAQERRFLSDVARIFGLRDVAAAGPWHRYHAPSPARVAELAPALRDLLKPGGAGSSGQALDRIEAATAGVSARLKHDPRMRAIVAGCAGLIAALTSNAYVFAHIRRPVLGLGDFIWSLIVGVAVGLVTLALLPRAPRPKDVVAEAARRANLDPNEVAGAIADAEARVSSILSAAQSLELDLRRKIASICGVARRILDGLRENPSDLARSRRFLGHYLVATEDLVKRYADLRARGGSTQRLDAAAGKLQLVLSDIEDYLQKQHERTLDDEALKLDVEIDVLRKTIKSEAI